MEKVEQFVSNGRNRILTIIRFFYLNKFEKKNYGTDVMGELNRWDSTGKMRWADGNYVAL
jgi:hypothetical protein